MNAYSTRKIPTSFPTWRPYLHYALLTLPTVIIGFCAWALAVAHSDWDTSSSSSDSSTDYTYDLEDFGFTKRALEKRLYGYSVITDAPVGLMIYVCLHTIILMLFTKYLLERTYSHLYSRLIILIAYFITLILQLAAWAYMADNARGVNSLSSLSSWTYSDSKIKQLGAALSVAAAFGAVMWICMVVEAVYYILACRTDIDDLEEGVPTPVTGIKVEQGQQQPQVEQEMYGQQPVYPQQ